MTSQRNRNTVHALTIYPTHPKFGTVITNSLSQKTTSQVRRPVVVVIHVRVNKIHVRNKYWTTNNPASSQITKPHPSTQQHKGQKQVTLSPSTPQSKLHPRKPPKNKNHSKGITNSWFKLPKFQTNSTPTQTGPHPKFMPNQVKSTPNLIFSQEAGPQTHRN